MKTYIVDTLNRLKIFSSTLDAKSIICNKNWLVFNDNGNKEVYIFQPDGTLIISINGCVTNATWKYIPSNKSLIISTKDESYMVHPIFKDDIIFALQLDGTNKCAFLIDEQNSLSFAPKTLSELENYLKKQAEFIISEKRKKQEEEVFLAEKKRLLIEEENHRTQEEKDKAYKYIDSHKFLSVLYSTNVVVVVISLLIIICSSIFCFSFFNSTFLFIIFNFAISVFFISFAADFSDKLKEKIFHYALKKTAKED